ncbi:unnamed protein product [Urochloa decumbens]|uniref:NAC domain-containing protein n=1 Tax=Urochloa decumbens TaxID=240449 RepID=A0ABC8XIQ0_9POAL
MAAPFQALPLGVYFRPSPGDCLRFYLKPWVAGVPPSTDRVIHGVDLYSDNPSALLLGLEPGFSRGFEYKWLALAHCTRQGGGRSRGRARMKRDVATGGYWKVEQSSKEVSGEDVPGGDRRCTNAFYTGSGGGKGRKDGGVKTAWLMEEFTVPEEEAGALGGRRGESTVPVFCQLYISPRASKDEKLLILGEARTPFDRHGNPKAVRVVLPDDLFDKAFGVIHGAQVQGQAPPPPWSAPHVPAQQHPRAERPLVVPDHHHHGLAMLPRGVPTHGPLGVLAAPPWPLVGHHHHARAVGVLAGPPRPLVGPDHHHYHPHHHGQAVLPLGLGVLAAPPQHFWGPRLYGGPRSGFLAALPHVPSGYFLSVQPPRQPIFAPYSSFESSPGPLQGEVREEGIHVRKKQRVGGADSDISSFIVYDDEECNSREKEPVPTSSAGQEITGTAAAASPAPAVFEFNSSVPPAPANNASGETTGSVGMSHCNIENYLTQNAQSFDDFLLEEDWHDFSDI